MKKTSFPFIFLSFALLFQTFVFGEQSPPKIGIVLSAFNRPEFLCQTLRDLQDRPFGPNIHVELVIIDDCCDPEAERLIDTFHLHDILIIRVRLPRNCGIANALSFGWGLLLNRDCDYLCNIDSDVLLKSNWIKTLYDTYHSARKSLDTENIVVTGFNANNHPIIKKHRTFYVKKSIGGINLFFPTKMYKKYICSSLNDGNHWDWSLVKILNRNKFPMVCTKPSVIQHIGINGLNSDPDCYDFADDF